MPKRSLVISALIAALLPGAAAAGDLQDFYADLLDEVNPAELVTFTGTLLDPNGDPIGGPGDNLLVGNFDAGEALGNLNAAAFADLSSQVPLGSSVAAFTYAFDPNLNVFVRSSQGLGPIFSERAQTTGKGKLNVAFSYSRVEFDVFESEELDSVPVGLEGTQPATVTGDQVGRAGDNGETAFFSLNITGETFGPNEPYTWFIDPANCTEPNVCNIGATGGDPVVGSGPLPGTYQFFPTLGEVTLDAEIDVDVYSLFVSGGVTDWLDVGIVVPFLTIDMKGEVVIDDLFEFDSNTFPALVPLANNSVRDSDDSAGVGDVILRAKARIFETDYADLATRLDVSIPTGDEDELLGRGNAAVGVQAIVSETFGRVSPHATLGMLFDAEHSELNQLRYSGGLDVRVIDMLSIGADVVGSRDLDSDGVGDNQVGVSGGLKFNPWRRLVLTGSALVRLNDEGLRSDVIPSGSIEYTFF
jgi:hypothetical protein